jgi:predicted acylesterase/phospholipase RssA
MGCIMTKLWVTKNNPADELDELPLVLDLTEKTVFEYNKWPFTHAVFEGGGINGVGYLGTYIVLHKSGILQQLRSISASSVGAIFGLFAALKVDYVDVQKFIMKKNFSDLKDDKFGIIRDVSNLLSEYGWYKGGVMSDWISEILKEFAGKEKLTFVELFNLYGTDLTITGSNINEQSAMIYNRDHAPNEYIHSAIVASMSIPIIFPPQKKTRIGSNKVDLIVDGGFANNYDLDRFDYGSTNMNVIGFKLMNLANEKSGGQISYNRLDINNFTEYLTGLIKFQTVVIENLRMKEIDKYWERTLTVPSLGLPFNEFDISDENKVKASVLSYNLAISQLNGWIKNKKFVNVNS